MITTFTSTPTATTARSREARLYTVSGPGIVTTTATLIDQANTNFAGGLIPANNSAGNYIRLSVTGTAFTLTAMPLTGGNSTLWAPVNGIQIVPKGS